MPTQRITTFASLVEGYQHTDPKLYQILQAFVQTIGELQAEVDPIVKKLIEGPGTIAAIPTSPTTINYEFLDQRILRIYWSGATNAALYEVRKGTEWSTATFVTSTNQQEVRLDPILVGSHTYLVRARNGIGVYAETWASIVVVVPPIGSISITAQIIDNNVLLRYSEPDSTWQIDYYDVFRNNTLLGHIDSNFFVWFENLAGTNVYAVEAVDIAGNRSARASVTAVVNQPPDFELQDVRISLLAGTRVNALIWGQPALGWDYTDTQGWQTTDYVWFASNTGKLLVCVDLDDTWTTHFTEDSWDQPSDQVSAGYPVYLSPMALSAMYQETIDYGGVFNNVILNLSWVLDQLSTLGTVTVQPQIEFSLDGLIWTAPASSASAFAESFRYARIRFDFTSDNEKALAIFSNLVILLDVKRDIDSGFVTALAADEGGTQVLFNKVFKDVDSITLGPTKQIEPMTAVYDFIDVPNPLGFKVFVFDSTGNRVTAVCSWKARGIV